MAAMKSYCKEVKEMSADIMCGDLFDHIDDLLEFPNDDFVAQQGGIMETSYNPGGGFILPTTTATASPIRPGPGNDDQCGGLVHGGDVVKNSSIINQAADTAVFECGGEKQYFEELDIADLEWVSNFMDDSVNSFALDYLPTSSTKERTQSDSMFPRTPSPVSVLAPNAHNINNGGNDFNSSSSSYSGGSGGSNSTELASFHSPKPMSTIPARARSKRPRSRPSPTTFTPRPQVITIHPFLDDESYEQLAAKKAKDYYPIIDSEETNAVSANVTVRKCTHCDIQKTPQWRAGPMGPKTLCNACGVRYKSGRLFPEYRPAASPTFVASLHSNSHKRVVEMRINGGPVAAPRSCDLLEYIRRKE